jgi:hypothetical protein
MFPPFKSCIRLGCETFVELKTIAILTCLTGQSHRPVMDGMPAGPAAVGSTGFVSKQAYWALATPPPLQN